MKTIAILSLCLFATIGSAQTNQFSVGDSNAVTSLELLLSDSNAVATLEMLVSRINGGAVWNSRQHPNDASVSNVINFVESLRGSFLTNVTDHLIRSGDVCQQVGHSWQPIQDYVAIQDSLLLYAGPHLKPLNRRQCKLCLRIEYEHQGKTEWTTERGYERESGGWDSGAFQHYLQTNTPGQIQLRSFPMQGILSTNITDCIQIFTNR